MNLFMFRPITIEMHFLGEYMVVIIIISILHYINYHYLLVISTYCYFTIIYQIVFTCKLYVVTQMLFYSYYK